MEFVQKALISGLLFFASLALGDAQQTLNTYTAADVNGASMVCTVARASVDSKQCVPGAKQFSELKLNGKDWVRVVSPRSIKVQLFEKLSQSFQFDAEVISSMGATKVWDTPEVQKSLINAQRTCSLAALDQSLSHSFANLISEARADNPIRQQLALKSDEQKEATLGRYLLARLELTRITRALNVKHVRGEEAKRLREKRADLQLRFPLAQQTDAYAVEDLLKKDHGLSAFSPVIINQDEEALVDQILGLKQGDSEGLSKKLNSTKNLNLSTQVALKVFKKEALSQNIKDEMRGQWQRTFSSKIEALGQLCDATSCQAYEVSHESTAELINSTPENERTNLLGDICNCNLSNHTDWVPKGVRYATIGAVGAGLVACLATNVACPALATVGVVGAVISGTDAVSNYKDAARGRDALAMSRSLDGLDPSGEERARLQNFTGRASRQALTATILTAGFGATNLKHAFSPITATKTIMKSNALQGESNAWLKEFLLKNEKYKSLPRAELDRIAKEVVGSDNRMGFVGEVFKAKDVNVRMYINQDGQEIFRFTSPAVFKSRTGEVVEHTLVRDAKTGAFDANSPEGLRLIEAMVEGSERGVVVIFQDLNYLGKTNYYHNGQAAGDKYLEAFGTSTREHLRPTDLTFKTGGDELVTILPITDEAMAQPEVVRTLTQRMSDSVSKSKQARAVFKEQSRVLSEEFKSVKLAAKFEDIPDAIASKLTPDQVKQAASNFVAFKESFLKNQIELLQSHAKFQPSISIGAAIVPKGSGTYAQAKVAAEGRAGQVKINYKKDAGTADEATLLKYGVTADDASNSAANFRRVEDIRPRALDPVILKAPPSANH